MGGFEVETAFFEMTEEQLETPAKLVNFKRFGAVETVADEVKPLVTAPLAGDGLAGEEDFQPPHHLRAGAFAPLAGGTVFGSELAPDNRIGLDADHVSNALLLKPGEPFATSELTIHGEDVNVFGLHQAEHAGQDFDPVGGVGVAAFGRLREDLPGDGNGDLSRYCSYRENIDVTLAVFPVGAVHGEHPAALRARDFAQNGAADSFDVEVGLQKESLETTIATLVGGTGVISGGKTGEVDGAVAQQTGKQKREAFEPGEIEFQGSEFFQEMMIKYPNFERPPALQVISAYLALNVSELRAQFLSCGVR